MTVSRTFLRQIAHLRRLLIQRRFAHGQGNYRCRTENCGSGNTGEGFRLRFDLKWALATGAVFSFKDHGISDERMDLWKQIDFDNSHKVDGNDGWEHLYEERANNLRVFRRRIKGMKHECYEYRVAGTFYDITPRHYIDAQNDVKYRSEWDGNVIVLQVLQEDGNQQLIRWVAKYPYPMYPREYVYVRRSRVSPDNKIVVIESEVISEGVVPSASRKNVRVATYTSQCAVRAHKDVDSHGLVNRGRVHQHAGSPPWPPRGAKECESTRDSARESSEGSICFDYVLTYFDNPEANIPTYVYNWIVNQGGPYFVKQVHNAAKELERSGRKVDSFFKEKRVKKAAEDTKAHSEGGCTHSCPVHCPSRIKEETEDSAPTKEGISQAQVSEEELTAGEKKSTPPSTNVETSKKDVKAAKEVPIVKKTPDNKDASSVIKKDEKQQQKPVSEAPRQPADTKDASKVKAAEPKQAKQGSEPAEKTSGKTKNDETTPPLDVNKSQGTQEMDDHEHTNDVEQVVVAKKPNRSPPTSPLDVNPTVELDVISRKPLPSNLVAKVLPGEKLLDLVKLQKEKRTEKRDDGERPEHATPDEPVAELGPSV